MGDCGAWSGLTTVKTGHPGGCRYSLANMRGVLSERGLTYMVYTRRVGFPGGKLKALEKLAGEVRALAWEPKVTSFCSGKWRLRWAGDQLAYAIIAFNFAAEAGGPLDLVCPASAREGRGIRAGLQLHVGLDGASPRRRSLERSGLGRGPPSAVAGRGGTGSPGCRRSAGRSGIPDLRGRMSLSYYFTFSARPETRAEELVAFLKGVETEAKRMGFYRTLVLDAPFDTAKRQEFARRLTAGLRVEDGRLAGATLAADASVQRHSPQDGSCRLMPTSGAVLVVTNEQGDEVIFGFFRYPEAVKDVNGRTVAETGLKGGWYLSGYVDSADPRYRRIVRLFAAAGYLQSEEDEFAGGHTA